MCADVSPVATGLPIRPGHPSWPRVWATYHPLKSREEDFAALRAAGIPVAVTIAPVLPCDPAALAARAMAMTARNEPGGTG